METGKYVNLILEAKESEKALVNILTLFKPLIKSYTKKLFFMEKEDAEQELCMAIIQAVREIPRCETEGQSITYLQNAIRYKYVYLCKRNIQKDAVEEEYCSDKCETIKFIENYDDIEVKYDLELEKAKLSVRHQKIFEYILEGNSDQEISEKMGISRQYINRVKKTFIQCLKKNDK